ncbi:MAG: hypothetical protein WCG15_00740 [Actinomycetes bacterium]
MFFNLAQTFYVDKSLVQNADDIVITSVDLYFKSKPKATNNKSGITNPGVSVLLASVIEGDVPDIKNTYQISERWAHKDYSDIAVSNNASTKTNFKFDKPVIVETNKSYAVVVCYDGNEDFTLWSAKEGDLLVGTTNPAPGTFAKNVGNYYEPVSQPTFSSNIEAYDWESAVNSSPGGLNNGVWKPIKDLDLKFSVYCGRFYNCAGGGGGGGGGGDNGGTFIKNSHEFIVFDRKNSYAIKGGRYSKEGGSLTGIVTTGWHKKFKPGEYVYQVTPLIPGTVSVNSRSTTITSDGTTINFNSLFNLGANSTQEMFVVLVSNSVMNTDSRNFGDRPKYKHQTGGTYYDPYRSDTDVRKIVSIVSNSQIIIDNNPSFNDPNARMSISPVAEVSFVDQHHHRIVNWDDDWWTADRKRYKHYDTLFLKDSNANVSTRFTNNTIEYASINTPPASFNNLFAISNGVSNSVITYDIVYADNSTFVAVGSNQVIQISNDRGLTWVQGTSNTTNASANLNLYAVTYGNNVFVAVGDRGLIYRSANAYTWTRPTSPNTDSQYQLRGAAYGNSVFVAVGRKGTTGKKHSDKGAYIISSADGNTWVDRSNSSVTGSLFGVAYGNSVFVTVGANDFSRSTDFGNTWSKVSRDATGPKGTFYDVAYGNGVFVAVGKGGIQTSTDGSTWTYRTVSSENFASYLFGVTYGNGAFVAVGGKGSKKPAHGLVSNNNGVDWTLRDAPASIVKYKDKQHLGWKIAYGNSIFVVPTMGTHFEMDDDGDRSFGQFIYANTVAINTRIPGSNADVGQTTGLGYSNSDRIEIYSTNGSFTAQNAYANIVTNASGSITNVSIYSPGYGFSPFDTKNNIGYNIWNVSNTLSSGTGANLYFSVGSTLRTEHSGIVFSNTVVVNLEVHKIIPRIFHSESKHHSKIEFKFNSPWYRDIITDDVLFGNGASHPTPNGGVSVSTTSNTLLNQSNTILVMSRSNELSVLSGIGNTAANNYTNININSTSNNDFSVVVPISADFHTGTYDVNNDSTLENTRYGKARAKHISTKINFAKDQFAQDLVVYLRAHRPVNSDIKVYAKVHNISDDDAFDDKDWTLLEYKTNADLFSSPTDVNDIIEYQLGFKNQPNTIFTASGVVTTQAGNSTITGTGTNFSEVFMTDDLVKIQSPLFSNNFQICVVNSVANDTSIILNDPITATGISGQSGLTISFLGGPRAILPRFSYGYAVDGYIKNDGYPYQAFNNINGNNAVRYYNSQMATFDNFNTFQIKVVMLSPNPAVVPMIEDIRAIGVSA